MSVFKIQGSFQLGACMNHDLQPTKRFMIEPSLNCNIKCKFCYHLHRYDTWKDTVKPKEDVFKEIDAGRDRGNEWMDITGGEPSIYPDILEVIQYAHSVGLKVCMITNGIISPEKTAQLINVGIDEFLVSRQGLQHTHNMITNTKHAYEKQCRFLNQISGIATAVRFNCVITKFNQADLYQIACELLEYKPKIVNFINFNPHHEWKNNEFAAQEVIANLTQVQGYLNAAIGMLESNCIGVNVRYYPMCCIGKKYRRCICNDLHVMFDPYEWDYCTLPKTHEKYYEWGVATSNANEEKEVPCTECDLKNICGGANKHFHKFAKSIYGEMLKPQKLLDGIDKNEYNYYRKDNILCL